MMKSLLYVLSIVVLFANLTFAVEQSTVKVDVLAKTGLSWDGKALPNYPTGKPEVTILKIVIPPKTELPLHEHPVINAGILLKGALTVITENKETLHLKAGEAIVEVVDKWHYGMNEGDEPAVIIVVYAGVKDEAISITKTGTNH